MRRCRPPRWDLLGLVLLLGGLAPALAGCDRDGGGDGSQDAARGPDLPGAEAGRDGLSPPLDAGADATGDLVSEAAPGARAYLFAGSGPNLHTLEADLATGRLSPRSSVAAGDEVRLIELDPAGERAYVHTQLDRSGPKAQAILIFRVAGAGTLSRTGELMLPFPSVEGVTQILVHPTAPWFLLSATNASPGLEDLLMPIGGDGALGTARTIAEEFYAFSWHPGGRHFYGLDGEAIFQYLFDPATGAVTRNSVGLAEASAGRTVLSLEYHPNGRWVYSVEEGAIGTFAFAAATGALSGTSFAENPVSTERIYWTALALDEAGRFLYALGYLEGSQQGIVDRFAIDPDDGALTFLGREKGGESHGLIIRGLQAPLVIGDLLVLGGNSTAPAQAGRPALVTYRMDGDSGALTRLEGPCVLPGPASTPVTFVAGIEAR